MRAALLLVVASACSLHFDFSGTHYRCDDGECPSGFACIADQCVMGAMGDGGGSDAVTSALPWWDTSFTHRANLTIANAATTGLAAGFEVGVAVDLATLDAPTASWNDLRVVRWDAAARTWTEQSRYPEGAGATETVWFDLHDALAAGASDTSDWLYFGNPSPTTAPGNGADVFALFDGFDGSAVDTTLWAAQGTPATATSSLTLHPGDALRSVDPFGPGIAVTAAMTAPADMPRFWVGLQQDTFTDSDPWMLWINRAADDSDAPPGADPGTIWPETYVTAIAMSTPDWGKPAQALDGQRHHYTVQRLADRVVFAYDEQVVYQFALPQTYTATMGVRLQNEGTASIAFDNVFVRHAVSEDPTVAIGPTENQ